MRSLRILVGIFLLILLAQTTGKFIAGRVDRAHNVVYSDSPRPEVTEAARKLHKAIMVADLHADPLLWSRDLSKRLDHGHIDLPRLIEGNVGLQVFGAVTKTPARLNYERNTGYTDNVTVLAIASGWPIPAWRSLAERALYFSRELHALADGSEGRMRLVRNRQDLQEVLDARAEGQAVVGALLGIEGAHALEGDMQNLDRLYEAGYRMLGLAHFFDNEVAGSAHGVLKGGLTPFGEEVIARAQAMGMIIDLSHASDAAARAVLRHSKEPVVFSHSGVRATCEQGGRNLDDQMLRRIRNNGGVVGIGLWPYAICGERLDGLFDAIDHAVSVAGINHVGLGSDFDGYIGAPIDASEWVLVTAGLLERGYSKGRIKKIMGGNVTRVLAQTLPSR